jgi:hypothetical protein
VRDLSSPSTPPRNLLLTDLLRQRQMSCEEPNFSCDDRCNAPIIRRKGSALLFLVAHPKICAAQARRSCHADRRKACLPQAQICFSEVQIFGVRIHSINAERMLSGLQDPLISRNSTVTGRPFPFPRFVNHSPIAAASRSGFTASPASSFPSPTGNVSSNSADPVKFRMQKLSSHSKGAARLSAPITISACSFRAYISREL